MSADTYAEGRVKFEPKSHAEFENKLRTSDDFQTFRKSEYEKKNQSRVAQSDSDGLLKLLSSYNGLFISLSRTAIYYYIQISYYL